MSTFKLLQSFQVAGATAVVEGQDGNLVVFCRGANGPFKIDTATGTVTQWRLAVTVYDGQNALTATAHPDSGVFYVTTSAAIYSIDPETASAQLVAGVPTRTGCADGHVHDARFSGIHGIAVVNGNLLVSDMNNNRIRLVDLDSNSVSTVYTHQAYPPNRPFSPAGLSYDHTKNAIVAAGYSLHKVIELDMSSVPYTYHELAGSSEGFVDGPVNSAQFKQPFGVVHDANGALIVIDNGNKQVRYVAPRGDSVFTVRVLNSSGQAVNFSSLIGPLITRQGLLVVVDYHPGTVYLLDTQGLIAGPSCKPQVDSNITNQARPLISVGAGLWQLRQQGQFCDVCFRVGGDEIQAHKAVLASRSEYFARSLSDQWSAGSGDTMIDIPETTAAAFRAVLEYLYTDEVNVPDDSLPDVLLLARRFLLFYLAKACLTLIKRKLNDSNAVKLFTWAHLNEVDELKSFTLQAVAKARKQLSDADKALLLQHPELLLLVVESV